MSWTLNVTFMPLAKEDGFNDTPYLLLLRWCCFQTVFCFIVKATRWPKWGRTEASIPVPVYHHYSPRSNSGMIGFLEVDQINSISIRAFFFFFLADPSKAPEQWNNKNNHHHPSSPTWWRCWASWPKKKKQQWFMLGTPKLISWKRHATPGYVGI